MKVFTIPYLQNLDKNLFLHTLIKQKKIILICADWRMQMAASDDLPTKLVKQSYNLLLDNLNKV